MSERGPVGFLSSDSLEVTRGARRTRNWGKNQSSVHRSSIYSHEWNPNLVPDIYTRCVSLRHKE